VKHCVLKYWILISSFFIVSIVPAYGLPVVVDSDFTVEKYVSGLTWPTTMSFVGDDILVLEKTTGNVRLVRDGVLQNEPVLHVNVYPLGEAGLLGITTLGSDVFLYFTETEEQGGEAIGNRIYKYAWDGKRLYDGVLVHDLPINKKTPAHYGGVMVRTLDNTILAVVGNVQDMGQQLKLIKEEKFHDVGIILRVNPEDSIPKPSLTENPMEHYFAMGIRNSFGLAIDPQTGYLWDTENGPENFDEINLVMPKFYSGWPIISGPANQEQLETLPPFFDFQYSDPEFSWEDPVAPTAITFVNSNLFNEYHDYILVGDFNTQTIFKFKLNSERTDFIFDEPKLKDLVFNRGDPLEEIVFSIGYPGITDLKFGPDGILYVVSIGDGSIYRILPTALTKEIPEVKVPEWLKNNVNWWSNQNIDESTFLQSMVFLIKNKIIILPEFPQIIDHKESVSDEFKINAQMWSDGLISEKEFAKNIENLVSEGLLNVNENEIGCDITIEKGIDLSYCDLTEKDFSDKDISNSKMKYSDLRNANFQRTVLRGSIFEGANLDGTNLQNSDLSNTDFRLANIRNATIIGADLSKSNFHFAHLENSNLAMANLFKSNFMMADMTNANLVGANLTKTTLKFAVLENSNLAKADLSNANFRSANLRNANLTNTNLFNVNFHKTILDGVSFNSDMVGAQLHFTSLRNQNLVGINFTDANMLRVDLTGAKLNGAILDNVDLRKANLFGADLTNASLKNADLTDANLQNAIIMNTDFTGAIMSGCIGCPQS